MLNKIDNFFDKMKTLFGPPYKDRTGEAAALLAKSLAVFDYDVLDATAEHFALNRKFQTWPMPVEIIAVCKDKRAEKCTTPTAAEKIDEWDFDHCKTADALILSEIGVQAAEGEWLEELWHFCRVKKRLPDDVEANQLFVNAEKHFARREASLQTVMDDSKWSKKSTSMRTALLNLHQKMQAGSARRRQLVLAWKQGRYA